MQLKTYTKCALGKILLGMKYLPLGIIQETDVQPYYQMVSFGLMLWHINHCELFQVKYSLYTYIKYICFYLVWFYGISTIVGYFKSNPLYTCILNMYKFVWFGFMVYHPLLVN